MADNNRLFIRGQGLRETSNVSGQAFHVVGFDVMRPVRTPIAAHIRRRDPVACPGERLNLMTPGIPALRKPVNENDKRTVPCQSHAQTDAIGLDHSQFGRHCLA